MHIILGVLATLVTILILLNRLAEAGIDLGGLNPFLWNRRRKWRNKYEGNPIYQIDNPMDATGILMVAVAKADGDITREDKQLILDMFENEFKLSKKDAAGLFTSSAHLLQDGSELRNNLKKFLAVSQEKFSETQAESAISLIQKVAGSDGNIHPNAEEIINAVKKALSKHNAEKTWA